MIGEHSGRVAVYFSGMAAPSALKSLMHIHGPTIDELMVRYETDATWRTKINFRLADAEVSSVLH